MILVVGGTSSYRRNCFITTSNGKFIQKNHYMPNDKIDKQFAGYGNYFYLMQMVMAIWIFILPVADMKASPIHCLPGSVIYK